MERAIAYIRVSSDRQVKDGSSLVTQERRVRDYAASKEYELIRVFIEEGETAKTDKRTELQALLIYAKEQRGRIQVLIFPKVDRFARYTEDYFHLKAALRALGMRVESADERFDDSPAGKFLESMLAATAQFDNDVRSERSKGGMREAVLRGRWVWGAPCGYRNVRVENVATIEPDPITGPLVREAFTRVAGGERLSDVRGWLARNGVTISRARFHKMLKSRAYVGVIDAFGVSQAAAPPFLPIISDALFHRARAAIKARPGPKTYQRDHAEFPLRGTLRCSCGRFLTASWSKGEFRRYAYYRCKHCPRVNLPSKLVEERWLHALANEARRHQITPRIRAELSKRWDNERRSMHNRFEGLSQEISGLVQLQKAIALKNAAGVLPDELARTQILEIECKLEAKRDALQDCMPSQQSLDTALDFTVRFLPTLVEQWEGGDVVQRKKIQGFFFPEGGTVEECWESRTEETTPLTGTPGRSARALSLSVAPSSESPNVGFTTLIDFALRLTDAFGSEA